MEIPRMALASMASFALCLTEVGSLSVTVQLDIFGMAQRVGIMAQIAGK